jgi:hypothetical protein
MNNMKKLYKKTCFIGIILAAAVIFGQGIAAAGTDRTVSVAGTATKLPTPGPVLDDFRYASLVNVWSTGTGTFSRSSATPPPANEICSASYVNDINAYSGYSLKLDYNVSAPGSFAGYYSKLASQALNGYTAVSFYVKGSAGGEFFKVELKNTGTAKIWDGAEGTNYYRNSAFVYVNDFHESGAISTEWKKVTIPFHNFANLDGFSSMKELVFIFENGQSGANGSPTSGTVYIDNIVFETFPISAVKIDACKDKLLVNSLGGNMGVAAGGGSGSLSVAALSDANHTASNAVKFDYNISADWSYAAASSVFGGGYTDNTVEKPDKGGYIKVPHDFSAYTNITFWARVAASDANNSCGFKVELHDFSGEGAGEPFYKIDREKTNPSSAPLLKTAWQKYTIPLASFMDWDNIVLHKDHIAELVFTVEWNNTPTGYGVGTLYIDDVQFE